MTFRSVVNLVSGKLTTDPAMRSCLARAGSTSTKVTNTSRSAAVGGSRKSTNVKQIDHFHSDSTARSFAKLADLCNN